MDELNEIGKSRDPDSPRSAYDSEKSVSSLSALKRPLGALSVVLVPPVLYCLLTFPTLAKGHPPGIVLPIAYLAIVAPVVTPFGAWFSFDAMERYPAVRGRALCLFILFLLGAAGSWITLASVLI